MKTVEVEVPGETVVVEKEVVKVVEVVKEVVVVEQKIVEGVLAPPVELKPGGATVAIRTKPTYGGTLRLSLSSDPGAKWDICEFKSQTYLRIL